jgi:isocitrate dehydrogenase (NAD+)
VPGANLGEECAVFEAVHGSAPEIAGQNAANPTAMILSSILMLRHLGQTDAGDRVERAIHHVYSEGRHLTRDVGGSASTDEFTTAVIGSLE